MIIYIKCFYVALLWVQYMAFCSYAVPTVKKAKEMSHNYLLFLPLEGYIMSDENKNENKCSEHSTPTSTELIERMQKNEEQAWEYFLRFYEGLIRSWANKSGTISGMIQDDLVQEFMLRLLKEMPKYDRSRAVVSGQKRQGHFRGWMKTICRNLSFDLFRKQEKFVSYEEWEADENGDLPYNDDAGFAARFKEASVTFTLTDVQFNDKKREFYEAVRKYHKSISNRDFLVFYYHVECKWTAKEVAEELNKMADDKMKITEGNVRMVANRIKNRLMHLIQQTALGVALSQQAGQETRNE